MPAATEEMPAATEEMPAAAEEMPAATAEEEELEGANADSGLSTIQIGDTDYYMTSNRGLFRRELDAEGRPTIGDWEGILEDDGVTIRETLQPEA
jgi:hypothetical protein